MLDLEESVISKIRARAWKGSSSSDFRILIVLIRDDFIILREVKVYRRLV